MSAKEKKEWRQSMQCLRVQMICRVAQSRIDRGISKVPGSRILARSLARRTRRFTIPIDWETICNDLSKELDHRKQPGIAIDQVYFNEGYVWVVRYGEENVDDKPVVSDEERIETELDYRYSEEDDGFVFTLPDEIREWLLPEPE